MSSDDALAALAAELEALATRFGRARSAIEVLAARARAGDGRGLGRGARAVAGEVVQGLLAAAGADPAREGTLEAELARLDTAADAHVPPAARSHLRTIATSGAAAEAAGGAAGSDDAFAALAATIALLRWYARAMPETVATVAPPRQQGRSRRPGAGRVAVGIAVALAAAAAAALLLSCRSPEEKLLDRRLDLRAELDGLYGRWGGSDVASRIGREARDGAAQEGEADRGAVGRIAGEVDRAWFEGQCLAVGRGERPLILSGRLDAFLKEPANAAGCRRAARLQAEIDALEREAGKR